MGVFSINPNDIKSENLNLNVTLDTIQDSDSGLSFVDYTGKKTFTAGFFRNSIGFGITNINIEIKTSLQPIIEIEFKDLYGNATFGYKKGVVDDSSIDYSSIFDWPPPKYRFSFKGYVGGTVTWTLNLKSTSTRYDSSDGSFVTKATFVPNQWGFFADLPFLFLYAVKKLKKDELGSTTTNSNGQNNNQAGEEFDKKVQTIFDIINIGKRADVKKNETSKEFEGLMKKLTDLKTNIVSGIINGNLEPDEIVSSSVNGRAPIANYIDIKINLPNDYAGLTKEQIIEKLKTIQNDVKKYQQEHKRILINSTPNGYNSNVTNALIGTSFANVETGNADRDNNVRTALLLVNGLVDDNIRNVEEEIKRNFFESSKEEIGKLTISEVLAQIAGDSAFMIGQILRAGLTGFFNNQDGRNAAIDGNKKIISRYFPLEFANSKESGSNSEEQVPAEGLGTEELEFVDKFIEAISFGIAENRRSDAELGGLIQKFIPNRINNLEIISSNPYINSDYISITRNILVRSGIAGYMTRSYDPNLPGNYDATVDKDSADNLQKLAEKELKNITDDVLLSMEDVDKEKLKTFLNFFDRLFSADGDYLLDAQGNSDENIDDYNDAKDWLVVLDFGNLGAFKLEMETQDQIKSQINNPNNPDFKAVTVSEFLSQFIGTVFYDNNTKPSLDASINFDTMTSNFVYNNSLLYFFPKKASFGDPSFVLFYNSEDGLKLSEAQNNESDSELSSDENQDSDEPTGIVKITFTKDNDGNVLEKVKALNDAIKDGRVIDYSKLTKSSFINELFSSGFNAIQNVIVTTPIDENSQNLNLSYTVYAEQEGSIDANFQNVNYVWGMFEEGYRGSAQRAFIKAVCRGLLDRLRKLDDERQSTLSKVLGQASSHKNVIYQQMHHIFHQWKTLAFNENGKEESEYKSLPFFLEEKFKSVTRLTAEQTQQDSANRTEISSSSSFQYVFPIQEVNPNVDVKVQNSIINIEPLYKIDSRTTVLNAISNICSKNNFMFFPIPGTSNDTQFNRIDVNMFKPQVFSNPKVNNVFYVMFSPTPESQPNKSITNSLETIQKEEIGAPAFEVKFGDVYNKLFSSFECSTEDNKTTAESIVNLQNLVDNQNQHKVVTTDCSLVSVMEGRSYTSSVKTLGNAQISPMMFYFVSNIPIFGGLYQIMSVNHSITPNNMDTSFKGMKMRVSKNTYNGVHPITLESLSALGAPAKFIDAPNQGQTTTPAPQSEFETNIILKPGEVSLNDSVTEDTDKTLVLGANNIPLFNQGDTRWGDKKGKQYTIKAAGCAITSLAMVTRRLTGIDVINPAKIFEWNGNDILANWGMILREINRYITSNPGKVSVAKELRTDFFPVVKDLNANQQFVDKYLNKGYPILLESKSKTKPKFSPTGYIFKNGKTISSGDNQTQYVNGNQHWMVITGKNNDGTYNINDPNGGKIRYNQNIKDILANIGRFAVILYRNDTA